MTLVIGLTGGIGSGKTVASDHFSYLGVPVIDTDIIARQIVTPGQPTLAKLSDAFGSDILDDDGNLIRSALRKKAFSSPEKKELLDSITHPAIRLATIEQIKKVKHAYCIVVVPLLKQDSPFVELMHRIIVVEADRETKINRVMKRSKLSRDETLAIMQSQISDQERDKLAGDIIINNGTIEDAQQAVNKLHKKYLQHAKA